MSKTVRAVCGFGRAPSFAMSAAMTGGRECSVKNSDLWREKCTESEKILRGSRHTVVMSV
ncbi:MAG: hypothetical protein Q4G22_08785 [Paracoccus sp. (in: a-proteobacteria)]|uniref:hypothetical protein n=1 Tax=Paracoccus sp. TaxID=267 RepID=UPI0026DF0C30|nr:hypothetical protein [Paracoccus sp. (in: a-proteobacteria)]MDO5631920.1 hypothetical protein [Paracoccus sp. (in: a-proteobacteria)]